MPFLACGERRPDGILRKGYAKPGTDRDHSRCAFMEKDAANGGAGNCPACFVSAGDVARFRELPADAPSSPAGSLSSPFNLPFAHKNPPIREAPVPFHRQPVLSERQTFFDPAGDLLTGSIEK
ncbi:MAG: hypothetical protein C6W56_10115 [Caldibacillus debilis]|nr:MAG: hypothetical protein C6W56_10115 [Caldibacillus debilis]